MNTKAQIGVGTIILLAITVIVGAILLQASAQNLDDMTGLDTVNITITAPANGGIYNVSDYRSLGTVTITNATDGLAIAAGNYTVTANQIVDGNLVTQITVDDAEFETFNWFVVSSTAQPTTYSDNAGSRSMGGLIIIFMALALAAVVIGYGVRNYI